MKPRSPIEIMVDKACGINPYAKPAPPPEVVLLALADASTAWYRENSIANFEQMKLAIKAWIKAGG